MSSLFFRAVHRVCRTAPTSTAIIESGLVAAFLTTVLLSFYGMLGEPLAYAGVFAASWVFLFQCMRCDAFSPWTPTPASRWEVMAICGMIGGLCLLACFMSPDSADEQRTKLARMIISTRTGSAWDTARMDPLAVMYFFPAAYYMVFTAIEGLRLIPAAYSIINALLVVGSMLNLWLLFGPQRNVRHLYYLALFFAAPQFVFSGLAGHEEGLTLFLATRAAVWFIAAPLTARSVACGMLAAILGVGVKLTTAVFLPGMLLLFLCYFGGKERVRACLHPRVMLWALAAGVLATLVVLLPDMMTNHDHGITFAQQRARLAAYHTAKDIGCAAAHFYLRLFELGTDIVRNIITSVRMDLTALAPDYQFMPSRCVHDSTALINYFMPDAMIRENTQFGALPLVAAAALFLLPAKQKRWAAAAWAILLASIAAYSTLLMYWSGTGRYFMIGILTLLPPFVCLMDALSARSRRAQRTVATLLLLPACAIWINFADTIPRRILRGDRVTYMAGDLAPALATLTEGKVNIYFNDLMSFYTLVRLIPSRDVWMKNAILPDATNIIALPQRYSPRTNWHNPFWILPVPSRDGEFRFVQKTRPVFGNIVPTAFYIGKPGLALSSGGVALHRYTPGESIATWGTRLGNTYRVQQAPGREETLYFIREGEHAKGLCIAQTGAGDIRWSVDATMAACRQFNGV